jgi:hypothetical protein
MTVHGTGAAPNFGNYWKAIDWQAVGSEARRFQMRVTKAVNCRIIVKHNFSGD